MRLRRLELRNFLSYRSAELELGNLTAVVGANASGKSNLVSAFRLLRDIPTYGLQTSLARRGGFDQLRHRSEGRPYDPSIAVEFEWEQGQPDSRYELRLGAKAGKRYDVKLETATIYEESGRSSFTNRRGRLTAVDEGERVSQEDLPEVQEGQSCLPNVFPYGGIPVWFFLNSLQTVEVNPRTIKELQDPSPPNEFSPDGANVASFYESLTMPQRQDVVDQLSAIVPGIHRVEPRHVADKLTLAFYQTVSGRSREFSAKQMSDGTLRAFAILVALVGIEHKSVVVIEEPEVAIHLGALRTLVEILESYAEKSQVLITTHSADIVDSLDVEQLMVVWSQDGSSHVSRIAEHSKIPVLDGLVTPGQLLRSDALDPDRR